MLACEVILCERELSASNRVREWFGEARVPAASLMQSMHLKPEQLPGWVTPQRAV
jgi:hypothetical protein